MHYTVYRVTNLINGKHYIGKHQTKDLDDGYMGSGKLIKAAIKKYGIENFTKEIIHVFDNEQEMNQREKELVVLSEMSYNLCEGGQGGFGYINSNVRTGQSRLDHNIRVSGVSKFTPEERVFYGKKNAKLGRGIFAPGYVNIGRATSMTGKHHTEEAKRKIGQVTSAAQKGDGNSQYGTKWVTNGIIAKKIPKKDLDFYISQGYILGRKISLAV
jgi:group I intron endonuclease